MLNLDACTPDEAVSECISLLFPSISVAAQVAINV
jgi:hypothetical protein